MSNLVKQCFKQQWNIHHNFEFAHFLMMDNQDIFSKKDVDKVGRVVVKMKQKGTYKDFNPHILNISQKLVDIFIK